MGLQVVVAGLVGARGTLW